MASAHRQSMARAIATARSETAEARTRLGAALTDAERLGDVALRQNRHAIAARVVADALLVALGNAALRAGETGGSRDLRLYAWRNARQAYARRRVAERIAEHRASGTRPTQRNTLPSLARLGTYRGGIAARVDDARERRERFERGE